MTPGLMHCVTMRGNPRKQCLLSMHAHAAHVHVYACTHVGVIMHSCVVMLGPLQASSSKMAAREYAGLISRAKFCMAPYGHGWGMRLTHAIMHACIPVIIQDHVRQVSTGLPGVWRGCDAAQL